MSFGSNTRPEGIVDKNGVATTRNKRVDVNGADGRSATAPAPKVEVAGYEAMRDTISDLFAKANQHKFKNFGETTDGPVSSYTLKPNIVMHDQIMVALIGEDPTRGRNTDTKYTGGKSKSAIYNERISVSGVNKVLDELIEDGELVKVKDPTYNETKNGTADKNAPFVSFPYRAKSGYILKDDLDDAKVAIRDNQNAAKIAKLRNQASVTIAERHADEVEEELKRLREEAGI
jgi:hypothetical protein